MGVAILGVERMCSVSGSGVITSPMDSVAGLRPLSTIRNNTSRSVKMPITLLDWVPSSVTTTQPRCSRCMARMASVTLLSGDSKTVSRTGIAERGSRSRSASKRSGSRGSSK